MTTTIEMLCCNFCGRFTDKTITEHGFCHNCRAEVRSEMLKYRPECRWWRFCDDLDGWRASHIRRPGTIKTNEAVELELLRQTGSKWRHLYRYVSRVHDTNGGEWK